MYDILLFFQTFEFICRVDTMIKQKIGFGSQNRFLKYYQKKMIIYSELGFKCVV